MHQNIFLRFLIPSSLKKESDLERFSWPILIGKIFKLSKSLFDCKSSRDGISSLQGAHQVAQKFNINNFPVKSSKFTS